MSRTPLFQVAFELQQAQHSVDERGLLDGDLVLEPVPLPQQDGLFDLTLDVTELLGTLHATFKYRTDLFDPVTIARIQGNFERLLEGIVKDPDQRIGDLPLCTADEYALLERWNRTEAPYPLDSCLHELIEAQAARTPDRVAVEFEGQTLTYRELDGRANQLAHVLVERGAGAGGAGGRVPGALARDGGGAAGRPQGGRRRTCRSIRRIRRSAWRSCWRTRGRACSSRRSTSRASSRRAGREPAALDAEAGGDCPGQRAAGRGGGHSRQPGLRHLHLGLDGAAQGRGGPRTRALVNLLGAMQREPGARRAADVLLAVTTLSFDIAGLELFLPLIGRGAAWCWSGRDEAADGAALAAGRLRATRRHRDAGDAGHLAAAGRGRVGGAGRA